LPVIGNGVDALSITWIILMQRRWFRLRCSMTMRQLGALVRQLYPMVGQNRPRTSSAPKRPRRTFAQMIFIKSFPKIIAIFRGKVPLEHWVSRIAVNTCLNQIESEKVRPELRHADLSVEEQAVIENLTTSSEELAPDRRLASRQLVEHLLAALKPVERLAI